MADREPSIGEVTAGDSSAEGELLRQFAEAPDAHTRSEAFTAWWTQHETWVRRRTRLYSGWAARADFADDLCQEVALKLHSGALLQLRDVSRTEAFLAAVIHNIAIDLYRRSKADRIEYVDDLTKYDVPARESRPPDRHVLAMALRILATQRGVGGRLQAEALVLRYYDGLGEEEMADRMGKSVRTVQSYLNQGRTAMKDIFATLGIAHAESLLG